jgi:uncharacterized protein (DUF885 family)
MSKAIPLLLSLVLAGCARIPSSPTFAFDRDGALFERLADDCLDGYLAWRPQTGVSLGLHQYDGRVTDLSRSSLDRELARLKSCQAQLGTLHPDQLSAPSARDLRLLHAAIERELFSFEQMEIYSRNPMTYVRDLDLSLYIKRDFAPLEQRAHSIVSVLRQVPSNLAAARANLAGELPRPYVETAIEQADGAADFLSKDLVEGLKEVQDAPLMAEFGEANRRAIDELHAYAKYLKDQKLPGADENYALGRSKYVQLLREGEMIEATPEQLLELGRAELRRLQQVFAETARQIDPAKAPLEVFKAIQREHPTAQNLAPDTARDLEAIRQYVLDRPILSLAWPTRAQVRETPQFLRATTAASMDTPGPFESKATEAYYYVTPVDPSWPSQQQEEWLTAFNYYTTDIVSIHEAYPGHYVQFLCLKASQATRVEKVLTGYAFVEGWAHYAEQMMLDEGFSLSPPTASLEERRLLPAKFRLAQTDEALLRACRFCVSILMHCQGMTVDEATRFFHENCYYELKPARQEAIRGTYDPEYLYYTLGKLEILKLREDYRRQEGSRFSLPAFHDELLRHGAPPIRQLREIMLMDSRLWDRVL